MCGPHTSLAEVLLERDELAGAADHIAKALEFARRSPTRRFVLYARTTAAQVFAATGDRKAASEQLDEARRFIRGSSDSRHFSFASSVELKVRCTTGELEAAAEVVRKRGLSPDMTVDLESKDEMTAYARYLVLRGDYGGAKQVLWKVLRIVRGGGLVQSEIHALVMQALAFELSGERTQAVEALGRATMLGEPGRFTRTFASEGRAMHGLLQSLAEAVRRGKGPAETGSPSYIAYLQNEAARKPRGADIENRARLADPLTAREVEVLRLVAAGKRNQEIADHLFISLATVKRHIANAYGKLAVTHRTEAVARANELNLL
jgi:LuxR family maltose regulon positive regulatory protein